MLRSQATALLATLVLSTSLQAQILDDTLVPGGQLRLQAHPKFTSWGMRFGLAPDGTEMRERLGSDLTDPTGLAVLPGVTTMVGLVDEALGSPGYAPTLGEAQGRIDKDVTRIDFAGHLGITDWLTIGFVFPWTKTRTAVDFTLETDTTSFELGLNPLLTNGGATDGYLIGLESAAVDADDAATAACSGGPGPACSAAQELASRTGALFAALQGAYVASAVFPADGSQAASDLAALSAALEADLIAAGLTPIGAPMTFATEPITEDALLALPNVSGAGLDAAPIETRQGLWAAGDMEVTALVRLLERRPANGSSTTGLAYRLTVGFLVRLPTGLHPDPDVYLDIGTGDRQTDYEGRAVLALRAGRFGLAAGARYGVQGATTYVSRVAPPEVVLAPLATRREVRWDPASYFAFEVVPSLQVSDALVLTGQLRRFDKGRDRFELVDPSLPLDASVLAAESGVEVLHVGAGLRYSTVPRWLAGRAPTPMEMHVRMLHAIRGSGGQTPVSTRVEAGIRLFKRFWGPEPAS